MSTVLGVHRIFYLILTAQKLQLQRTECSSKCVHPASTSGEPPMSTVFFPVLQADAFPAPQTLASTGPSGALEALGPAVIVTAEVYLPCPGADLPLLTLTIRPDLSRARGTRRNFVLESELVFRFQTRDLPVCSHLRSWLPFAHKVSFMPQR